MLPLAKTASGDCNLYCKLCFGFSRWFLEWFS